jgi:hypothetical protein
VKQSNPARREGVRVGSTIILSFCILRSCPLASVFSRYLRLLVPARAAVAVLLDGRAIQASTILKYGQQTDTNGNERKRTDVEDLLPAKR